MKRKEQIKARIKQDLEAKGKPSTPEAVQAEFDRLMAQPTFSVRSRCDG
jgi:hypothetical protein